MAASVKSDATMGLAAHFSSLTTYMSYVINIMHMIRTQIYLTEEQTRSIKLRSRQEGRPEAEVIRELLDKGIALGSGEQQRKSTGQTLLDLASLGKRLGLRGPADLSSNLDDYLYGDKK